MKIAIMGYSGSGKSTLARTLAEYYGVDVLHFDTIQFLPGWVERSEEEKLDLTKIFLDTHDGWVIDGTYSKLFYARRLVEADVIVLLLFNRFACLARAFGRYLKYKGKTRPDMAEGCYEKFDWEFFWWLLRDGRTETVRQRYRQLLAQYADKTLVIKNQRQLNAVRDVIDKTYLK